MAIIMNPYAFGLAALELSYVSSSIASSVTVALPTGWADGDLAILYEYVIGDPTATLGSDPAGWTLISKEDSFGSMKGRVLYRVLQSGDGSPNTGTTAYEVSTCIIAYRPTRAIASVAFSTWNKQATTGNPAAQTVSASAGLTPLVVCALSGAASSSFGFSTASPAFDVDIIIDGAASYAHAAAKLYNSSPSDHTIDMNDQGTRNVLMSGYLAIT